MKRMIVSPEANLKVEPGSALKHDAFHQDKEDRRTPEFAARIKKADLRSQFVTLAEQVAKSTVYYLNHRIPDAEKYYPIDTDSRFVSKFFPYAVNGPLYVDEPRTEAQMLKSYEKQKLLKKLKLRSIVIELSDEYKDLHTGYFHCLEQLGEI